MTVLGYPAAALGWLGRQGTRAVAASLFIGLAAPQAAAFVKPYLGETVFILLTLSILRVDLGHLHNYFRAPKLILAASAWIMVLTPLALGLALYAGGLAQAYPLLFLVLILQIATTPITSAPAFAALMGLDVALSLGVLIVTTVLSPLTTPGFAYLWAGSELISPVDLGLRTLAFYAAAISAAGAIFYFAGKAAIERKKDYIDGVNVLAVFVFAIAAMDGVADQIVKAPLHALALLAVTFAMAGVMMLTTALAFLPAGRSAALTIGVAAGSRNLGVLMAVIGVTRIPDEIWLYFALSQFPIYLAPQLLKPLARRFGPRKTT